MNLFNKYQEVEKKPILQEEEKKGFVNQFQKNFGKLKFD
jgi:hypothetical protein